MSTEDYAYVGKVPECGCVVAAVHDVGPHGATDRKTVAKWVANMITDGLLVERVSNDYVRAHLCECQHGQLSLLAAPAPATPRPGAEGGAA